MTAASPVGNVHVEHFSGKIYNYYSQTMELTGKPEHGGSHDQHKHQGRDRQHAALGRENAFARADILFIGNEGGELKRQVGRSIIKK